MSEKEELVFDIRAEGVEKVKQQYRDIEKQINIVISGTYGILGLLKRMNLPEDIIEVIRFLQQLVTTLNMLTTAMYALWMASGPWGWAMAGIGLAGTAISVGEQVAYAMRE